MEVNMRDFEKILNEQLDSLQLASPTAQGKLDLIRDLQRELQGAAERVAELQMEIRHASEELNIELAKCLKRRLPQVGVKLDDGKCSLGYKSTNLSCWPDLNSGIWAFEPNKHGRTFMRRHGPSLRLHNKVEPLADAIATYFGRYKSLG
jgi:hypothetical protein